MATIEWYEETTAGLMASIDSLPEWCRGRVQAVWRRDGAEVLGLLCGMLLESPELLNYPRSGDGVLVIAHIIQIQVACQNIVINLRNDIAQAQIKAWTNESMESADWKAKHG